MHVNHFLINILIKPLFLKVYSVLFKIFMTADILDLYLHYIEYLKSPNKRNKTIPGIINMPAVGRKPSNDHLGPEQSRCLLQRIIIYQPCSLVQSVGHGLKINTGGGDSLGIGHEPMCEMTAMRQI